jgi:type I restriction enzyme S subunit
MTAVAISDLPQVNDLKALGSVPDTNIRSSWGKRRLAAVARVRSERNQPDLDLLSVFLGRGVIPYGQGGGQVHKPSADLSAYQVVHPGDLVLNNQQAWRGSVGVSRHHGIVSPAYVVLMLSDELDPGYARYLFQSPIMVGQFVTSSKGVGDIQRDVYMPWLRNTRLPLPDTSEQVAIARFLSHVEGRVRRLIRAKLAGLALLNEQKRLAVSERLSREGNALEGVRLKTLLRRVDRRSITGSETLLSLRKDHGVVVYAEHFARPAQAESTVGYKLVQPGQLVVNRLQANNGLIFHSSVSGVISPDYSVFEATQPLEMEYLAALLRTPPYAAHFRRRAKGLGTGTSGFLRLYDERFLEARVTLPRLDKQRSIIAELRSEAGTVERLARWTDIESSLLDEYWRRLLVSVVTGQVDVVAAAASLPEEVVESEPLEMVDTEEILEAEEPEVVEA